MCIVIMDSAIKFTVDQRAFGAECSVGMIGFIGALVFAIFHDEFLRRYGLVEEWIGLV